MPGRRGRPQHPLQSPDELLALPVEETLEPRREFGPVDRPLRQLYPYALRPEAVVPVPVLLAVPRLPAPSLVRAVALGFVGVLVMVAVLLGLVAASLSVGEDVREVLVHLRCVRQ